MNLPRCWNQIHGSLKFENEVEPFGHVSKNTRHVGQNSWEMEACGDIGKGKVDDLLWVAHSPIVDIDEEVNFCSSKINGCLVIRAGLVI
jgi:hypothetical protein